MKYLMRGEVWLVDLGMTEKVRPCLVINVPIGDGDRAITTVVPHTTSTRGTQFECAVRLAFLKPGAFDAQGILTIPTIRAIRLLGTLGHEQLGQVEAVLCRWLGLPCSP